MISLHFDRVTLLLFFFFPCCSLLRFTWTWCFPSFLIFPLFPSAPFHSSNRIGCRDRLWNRGFFSPFTSNSLSYFMYPHFFYFALLCFNVFRYVLSLISMFAIYFTCSRSHASSRALSFALFMNSHSSILTPLSILYSHQQYFIYIIVGSSFHSYYILTISISIRTCWFIRSFVPVFHSFTCTFTVSLLFLILIARWCR